MKTDTFHVKGKEITLYHAANADSPLILFNHFSGEGEAVMAEARKLSNRDFSLLCVGNVDWNHDMSPWHCPPIMPGDAEYTGGADVHLQLLVEEILPEGLRRLEGKPSHIGIAGYSLAGLFALYALYRTNVFDRAASVSGSLWYPEFRDYVQSHEMKRKPEKLYISLGDKEAKTRNPLMRAVDTALLMQRGALDAQNIPNELEWNPGNHFVDAALRTAKGHAAMIRTLRSMPAHS